MKPVSTAGIGMAAALMLAPLLLAPQALAQSGRVVTSARACAVLSADNYRACCAPQNAETVAPYLTSEGRRICGLERSEQARLFQGQPGAAAVGPSGRRGTADPGGGAGPGGADTPEFGNPGNERTGKDGNEVGRAGESPGSNPDGSFGGESQGRGDVASGGQGGGQGQGGGGGREGGKGEED